MQQCRNAVALAAGVDDQDHRGARADRRRERWTPRRSCTRWRPAMRPSNRPITPSTTAMSAARAAVPVQRTDQPLRRPEPDRGCGPGRRGGQRVVAGVDEVWADLERRDRMARSTQGTHQTRCHRGLSTARRGRGDHDGGRRRSSQTPASVRVCWRHAEPRSFRTLTPKRRHAARPCGEALTIRCLSGPCARRPSGA